MHGLRRERGVQELHTDYRMGAVRLQSQEEREQEPNLSEYRNHKSS